MRGIAKRFGEVVALDSVDFSLRRREVHALAGENGAGKTTLMNVLAGLYQADAGEVAIDGRPVRIGSPRDALKLGIGMVHQHFELVQPFTALENIVLGAEGGGWRLRKADRRRDVVALMERYGLTVDLDARVRDVSIGVQQKVEILKALFRGVDTLILDEPTTHLTPQEVDGLFGTMRQLVVGGLTVVLITHKLREIRGLCDRVTVMRRGRIAGTVERAEASEERLVELLMGSRQGAPGVAVGLAASDRPDRPTGAAIADAPERPDGRPVLELDGITVLAPDRRPVLDDCSLEVRAGEVLGVAGVAGNGQRELAEAIVGTRAVSEGRLRVGGRDLTGASVRERLLAGVAYVPEDRLREGILPRLSVAETFVLGPHHALFKGGWAFDERRARSLATEAIEEYRVVAPSERAPTARLSGGNIQKVLIARAMLLAKMAKSAVLVALNPARGLDIGTMAFVHRRLLELRDRGGAVLLVSEDLDELTRLSDRIVVMYRGRIAGRFARGEFDPYRIGALMAGADEAGPAAEAVAVLGANGRGDGR